MLLNKSIPALKNSLLILKLVLGPSRSYIIAYAYVTYIDVEIFPFCLQVLIMRTKTHWQREFPTTGFHFSAYSYSNKFLLDVKYLLGTY